MVLFQMLSNIYNLCYVYLCILGKLFPIVQESRMHRYGIFGRVLAPSTSRVRIRVPYGYKGTQRVPNGKIEISKIWVRMVRQGYVWVRILDKTL